MDESNPSRSTIKRRHKALCVQEIIDELLNSDNDDEIETVITIPPEAFDGITDEEDIDDESLEPDELLEKNIAGSFEIVRYKAGDDVYDLIDDAAVMETNFRKSARIAAAVHNGTHLDHNDEQLSALAKTVAPNIEGSSEKEHAESTVDPTRKYKLPSAFSAAKWEKVPEVDDLPFEIVNVPEPLEQLKLEIQRKLNDKLNSDIFYYFFDAEVYDLIVAETKRYAMQHNDMQFAQKFNKVLLKRFIGILVLSSYNKMPQLDCYWSKNPTLGSKIVQQTMPRSLFRKIKKYLHFHDSNNLDRNHKYTKMRAIFDMINKKFMQFGVFEENLSIDEQMLPYFGRHSCKMYMKSKPIKFGYKIWCMAASSGYVFRMVPYGGASDKYDKSLGLGASVVMDMLNQLEFPARHQLYIDNFFTSHYLMCLLTDKRICATGTVRGNRLGRPVPDLKTGKALPKGEIDAKFDAVNSIVCCRWQDKREVTLLSNFTGVYPLTSTLRRQRSREGQPGQVIVQQPKLMRNYNCFMGGVDLNDNAVSNYRVSIRSKKWWWPLWLAIPESSVVNAWKLKCLVIGEGARISQLSFRVDLATNLLRNKTVVDSYVSENILSITA